MLLYVVRRSNRTNFLLFNFNLLDIEKYERPKLRVLEKVPQHAANTKVPKMQKRLRLMRGPELVHNTLLHKQYGIVATGGGRMRHGFFEMIRLCMWPTDSGVEKKTPNS